MELAGLKSTNFSNKSKTGYYMYDISDLTVYYVHNNQMVKVRRTPEFHRGHSPAKALSGSGVHDGDLLAIAHSLGVHEGDTLGKPHSGVHDGDLLGKPHGASLWTTPLRVRQVIAHSLGVHDGDQLAKARDQLAKAHSASLLAPRGRLALAHQPFLNGLSFSLWAPPHPDLLAEASLRAGLPLAKTLSNQGESSGSGGGAGEERNGRGGYGNQGIGGGVGGGVHREGSGTEQRGSRGRSHGGGNGDDDDNDHGGQFGYILNEGRQRPVRIAEILLPFNFQVFGTVKSFDITGLSVRVRSVRVLSLGFTSAALVCLSASIRQRGTNPRLASFLSWIGSVATFLGFISMITMALWASFIP